MSTIDLTGPGPGDTQSARSRSAPPKPSWPGFVSGIYGIWCTANERWYVGQSLGIPGRWWSHQDALEKDKHPNRHLQAAWNKYGAASFLWVALCNVFIEELLDLAEETAIAELQAMSPFGFNLKTGGANGRPSPETRDLWSKTRKGRPLSSEHKANVLATHPWDNLNTPEARLKAVATRKLKGSYAHSIATRQKISEGQRGRTQSPESVKKRADALRGRRRDPAIGQKISSKLLGRPKSEEHRKKCLDNLALAQQALHKKRTGS